MNRNHRHRVGAWASVREQQRRETEANNDRRWWPVPPVGVSRPGHVLDSRGCCVHCRQTPMGRDVPCVEVP